MMKDQKSSMQFINIRGAMFNVAEIQAVSTQVISRNANNYYCVSIYVWLRGMTEPFKLNYVLLPPKYVKEKVFFFFTRKVLFKHTFDYAINHKEVNKINLNMYNNEKAILKQAIGK